MDNLKSHQNHLLERRERLHDLIIALILQQNALPLLDSESPDFDSGSLDSQRKDPAVWLDHNRRLIKRYQSMVRTAVTLDALLDAEMDQPV